MTIEKVLVVDDSATDRKKLEQILSDAGYRVATASSGKAALESAKRDLPDAVLVDVIMADMNGFQVCRAFGNGEGTRDVPVILVSSKREKIDQAWGQEQGARGFITKPYTTDQILSQLRAL